jgi:hypothetical protein
MCSICKIFQSPERHFYQSVVFCKVRDPINPIKEIPGIVYSRYDNYKMCRRCFKLVVANDSNYRIFQSKSKETLKGRMKDGNELLKMVLKLACLDLPPSWGYGTVSWFCRNVFFDNQGETNNMWNVYLDQC